MCNRIGGCEDNTGDVDYDGDHDEDGNEAGSVFAMETWY